MIKCNTRTHSVGSWFPDCCFALYLQNSTPAVMAATMATTNITAAKLNSTAAAVNTPS